MFNTLRRILASPIFANDENKTRSAFYLNIIVLASAPLLLLLYLARVLLGVSPTEPASLIILGMIVVLVVAWSIMRSGAVRLA